MVNFISLSIDMFVMFLSQAISWEWVSRRPLFQSVFRISVFYFFWSLYDRLFGVNVHEIGFFTLFIMAVAAYSEKANFCMIASILVFAQYAFALYTCFGVSASTWAETVKGSTGLFPTLWSWTYRVYVASNLGLWAVATKKFSKNEVNDYDALPSTN